jgi:PAS domain S-box-containing protein
LFAWRKRQAAAQTEVYARCDCLRAPFTESPQSRHVWRSPSRNLAILSLPLPTSNFACAPIRRARGRVASRDSTRRRARRTPTEPGEAVQAPLPDNEEQRLHALYSEHILDTLPEKAFDDLAKQAAFICGTPISQISFIDKRRQWCKASVGAGSARETPREQYFCAHEILKPDELLVVEDAAKDERFSNNPLVAGEMNIRFYAGVPLVTDGGHALGSLCVMDTKSRALSAEQLEALKVCRTQGMRELELKRKTAALSHSLGLLEETQQRLQASELRYRELVDHSLGLLFIHDLNSVLILVHPAAHQALGYREDELIGRSMSMLLSPASQPLFARYLERIRTKHSDAGLLRIRTKRARSVCGCIATCCAWTKTPSRA